MACRTPNWECMVIELPSCTPLKSIILDIGVDKECQQIRFVMVDLLCCDYPWLSNQFLPRLRIHFQELNRVATPWDPRRTYWIDSKIKKPRTRWDSSPRPLWLRGVPSFAVLQMLPFLCSTCLYTTSIVWWVWERVGLLVVKFNKIAKLTFGTKDIF